MKSIKKIKKSTIIVIISVIALTLLTMNTTYSYIFSVKSYSSVQTFKAGTLDVSITGSQKMKSETLMPAADEDYPKTANEIPKSDSNNSYATLTLSNQTGNLDAEFSVNIDYDMTNLPEGKTKEDCASLSNLKIGIYDDEKKSWVDFGSEGSNVYYTTITSLNANSDNSYPILSGRIDGGKTKSYQIFIWLSDTTPTTEIGKLVYLELNVKSTPVGQE